MAETLTTIERQHVEVTALPGALAELWAQIEASENEPLIRSLTLNFLWVTRRAQEPGLSEAIERLLVRHPCRAFVVVLEDGDREADVQAQLGAVIRQGKRSRQTVLEMIRLEAPARSFAAIPSIIRPLVVNDLPVHLFWGTPLPENTEDLMTMVRIADQTIFDSCLFDDPIGDLDRLAAMTELRSVDLAFFRLRPWRRALAEAFESFGWSADRATRVELVHGPECGAVAAVRTLSLWLEQRLGAVVTAREVRSDAPPSEPWSLELHHGDVKVCIEHAGSAPQLTTTVTLPDRCLLPFSTHASRGRLGDLLGAAVDGL